MEMGRESSLMTKRVGEGGGGPITVMNGTQHKMQLWEFVIDILVIKT